MGMDIRDFSVWRREAYANSLRRKMEAYSASLLPHLEREAMKSQYDDVCWRLYGLEHEESIDSIEELAKKRLDKMRARKKLRGK